MISKIVILDGHNNYIKVNIMTKDRSAVRYSLKNSKKENGVVARFKNMEIARLTAEKIINRSYNLAYVFCIDDKEIDVNDTQKVGGYYQYYDLENQVKYFIKEDKNYPLFLIGYFCFENGNQHRSDKEYGLRRQKELIKLIIDAIDQNIIENEEYSIIRKERISSREYCLYVKDSTARIHLMANSVIMDMNQSRKEKNMKCIPFSREMDKYLTIFVFATKDDAEKIFFKSDKKTSTIIERILEIIKNIGDEELVDELNPQWIGVPFNGYVTFDEDKTKE